MKAITAPVVRLSVSMFLSMPVQEFWGQITTPACTRVFHTVLRSIEVLPVPFGDIEGKLIQHAGGFVARRVGFQPYVWY
jgi:hypothetical protein